MDEKEEKIHFCFQRQLIFVYKSRKRYILTCFNGNVGNFEYHSTKIDFRNLSWSTEIESIFHRTRAEKSDCSNCFSIRFTAHAVNWYCYLWAHTLSILVGKINSSLKFEASFKEKHKGNAICRVSKARKKFTALMWTNWNIRRRWKLEKYLWIEVSCASRHSLKGSST